MPDIRATKHRDLDAVEIAEDGARMVLVHEVGPRIASFGLSGRKSLLYWDELANRKRAGDRLQAALAKDLRGVAQLRLPTIEAADPALVVRMLATNLGPHLAKIEPA